MARNPRYRRWTPDTETAFLMALRVTGSVTRACAEIGRSTSGAYWRRQQVPAFDAKYRQVLDEWQAEQAAERRKAIGADDPGVMPNRVRFDGFTPIRQRAFLRALTETGSVEDACKRIGISRRAATQARRSYPSFSEAWDRAQTHCEADLEQIAIERAIEGVDEQVAIGGQLVTRKRYPEALMAKMIDLRERRSRSAAAAKAAEPEPLATKEETVAAILKKLDALDRAEAAQLAAKRSALWAQWQESWASFGSGCPPCAPTPEDMPPEDEPPEDEHDGAAVRFV